MLGDHAILLMLADGARTARANDELGLAKVLDTMVDSLVGSIKHQNGVTMWRQADVLALFENQHLPDAPAVSVDPAGIQCAETRYDTRGDCDDRIWSVEFLTNLGTLPTRQGETGYMCGSHGPQAARANEVRLGKLLTAAPHSTTRGDRS
jgi:hypothetical protein